MKLEPHAIGTSQPLDDQTAPSTADPGIKPSTLAAYAKDLRLFESAGGCIPCDAEALRRYLCSLRNRIAPTTLYRRAMAIRHAHLARGLPPPTTNLVLRRTLRQLQSRSVAGNSSSVDKPKLPKPAKPITRAMLAAMVTPLRGHALERRDRALLLLGFFAALSRAQLVAIDLEEISFSTNSMRIRPKEGRRELTLPFTHTPLCTATAVRKWIECAALRVQGGPLFCRCDRAGDATPERLDSAYVSITVKQRLAAAGYAADGYSGNSLRRGKLLDAEGEVQ